ncbi:MAG: hypothetical protein BGO31_04680 [Bacteroidetes bacterium 43-16]|nr:MAG: hypothetical protein BGO31_04680 [Bacteroidetes bacterium 43-16]
MRKPLILGMSLLSALISCKQERQSIPGKSVYYWKLNGSQNDLDTQVLNRYGFQHFYVKLMDVDIDPASQKAGPKASLTNWKALENAWGRLHTPVIFINNNCLLKIDSAASLQLARDVDKYVQSFYQQLNILYQDKVADYSTLQIDCDWTKSTKDQYFYFLKELKALNPRIRLSATLRMYPYKYFEQMGVPPVDELSLMCYNLGKIKELDTYNSILDTKELKAYLNDKRSYPKPLNIALPCFGWMVWFRNGEYKHILYLSDEQLDAAHFSKKANSNRYMALKDTVIAGQYVRTGDILRSEWPSQKELQTTIKLLAQKEKAIKRISYFHFDTALLQKYEPVINGQQ